MRGVITALVAAAMLSGCMPYGAGPGPRSGPNPQWRHYDYNHPDPTYGGYYADRYYRADTRYRERVLTRRDRVYRGMDGRYYCRRSDGTTGLVVGAALGAILGNAVTRGDSSVPGTILGATAGAVIGKEIDQGQLRCR